MTIIDAHAHIFSHACPHVAPPALADGRFPCERLLELMDSEGVAQAVLMQNPTIGTINEEVRRAISAYSDRFAGVIQTDPLDPGAPAIIKRFSSSWQCALKLEMSQEWGWSGVHPGIKLDGPEMDGLWGAVADLSLVVIIDPGSIGNSGYQVEAIRTIAGANPGISFVLEHLGYLEKTQWCDEQARARRQELIQLALHRNVYLGISAVGMLLEEPYPCKQSLALLEDAVRLVGASKLLWGTDVPYVLRRYTYRELLDVIRAGVSFLSKDETAAVLGGNASRLFFKRNSG